MNIDSNKVLEWIEENVEDCFVIGDNGVYHLDTFLLEDKYKVFVDQATENEDKVSIKVWSEEDEETLDYIIDYIENNKSHDKIYTKKTEILEGMIDWLKSLKERIGE